MNEVVTNDHKWYILHVYSGFEQKVIDGIRDEAARRGLDAQFSELVVPAEQVEEVRRNKRIQVERKFFPGYVLVKMKLSDEAWSLVKNIPRVTGFLGGCSKPMAISEAEAQRTLAQMQESVDKPRPSIQFSIGEQIRVKDGPFASFNGTVETIDEESGKIRVSVSIFGRATPVELDFNQAEKAG